ncbi:hypothetical protein BKI52_36255 [marine bacterium AO1-C]|nr:hypothetical protein BKI52_36255 [marine bacterium AO1-C]
MIRFSILIIIYLGCVGCSKKIVLSKSYTHQYSKYWEKYTWQEIKDANYTDTLIINFRDPEGNPDNDTRDFYLEKISLLLADLKDDWGKVDSLYPQVNFNAVKVSQLSKSPFKKTRYLNQSQIDSLLEVLNNPLNFYWSETTFEAAVKVEFLQNNKVVANLQLMDDCLVVEHPDSWVYFKKMKFGMLHEKPRLQLVRLLHELGFRVFQQRQ